MARRRRSVTAVTTPFDSCIAAMWAKANTVHLGGTGLLAWPPVLSLCHAERARPPPIFPSAHQPRHHRILLDIANDLGQLFRPPHPMIVRFHLAKTAGASFGARQTRAHRHPPAPLVHPSVQNGAIGDRWPLHPGAGPLATKTLPGESRSEEHTSELQSLRHPLCPCTTLFRSPAPLVHPSVQNGAIGDRWPLHPGAGPLATKTLPGESCRSEEHTSELQSLR